MIKKTLIILFGVACAAVTMQAPEFMQQYTQRLGGWLDAYTKLVADLDADAKQFGMTRDEYVGALLTSPDPKVVEAAKRFQQYPVIQKRLQDMQTAFDEAPVWKRGLVFVQNMEDSLLREVYGDYKPAMQMTGEGGAYGAAGFGAGAILAGILFMVLRLLRRLLALPVDMIKRRRGGGKKFNV